MKGDVELTIEYEGTHNDRLYGFYRARISQKEYMLSTQFETAKSYRDWQFVWKQNTLPAAPGAPGNPANPTNGLSLAQLRDLFQGKTFDWTPFNGTGDVIPVSREANALARTLFEERVMSNRAVTQNAVLKSSTQEVADFVANNPGAIGYVSISAADTRVKILPIEGVMPNPTTAAANQYSISAPIYLIAQSEPSGDLREFTAWLLGDVGQKLISQSGLGRVR